MNNCQGLKCFSSYPAERHPEKLSAQAISIKRILFRKIRQKKSPPANISKPLGSIDKKEPLCYLFSAYEE